MRITEPAGTALSASMVSRSVGCGALSTLSPASFVRLMQVISKGMPLGGKTSSVSPTQNLLRCEMTEV